jgi:hypothetical protein
MLATGLAAQTQGHWKAARVAYEQAEQIFRDNCRDIAWELHTAQSHCSIALVSLGECAEFARRLPTLVQEAQDRGSLHAWTNVNGFLRLLPYTADDDSDGAWRALDNYKCHLPRWGFTIPHVQCFLAEGQFQLYFGSGEGAWECCQRYWPALERSLFIRLQIVRILTLELRGRCALAAALRCPTPASLLRSANQAATRLERERTPWATAHALLLRAGIAAFRGDLTGAVRLLEGAACGFDAVDMALYAAVARRRLGEVLGGAKGQELVDEADTWMAGQLFRNPRRLTNSAAPGFPL